MILVQLIGDKFASECAADGARTCLRLYQALKGGPHHEFNDAISLSVDCADQAELDHYWNGLVAGGGEFVQCGWLKDCYGVSWQIVPEVMDRLMSGGTPEQSRRVFDAMMQMVKLDIDALQRAYDGAE